MARPRSSPFRGRVSGPRRQTTWVAPADQSYVSVASGVSAIIASFDPSTFALLAPTIVRTRGQVSVRPAAFNADVALAGAYGVCVVSSDAFAAGAASIPRPFDDADWGGWYVWRSFTYHFEFADLTGFARVSWEQEIDSKAMRKVTSNETVVMMCESQTGGLQIAMPLRTLLKMS